MNDLTQRQSFRNALTWVPFFLWAGLIFILSDTPQTSMIRLPNVPFFDKGVHILEFFILGILFIQTYPSVRLRISYQEYLYLGVVIIALYGFSDEWHQFYVPTRTTSAADFLADTVGGLLASGLAFVRYEKRHV